MASQDWFDKDFYKVLGVEKNVSDADLKKTYRKLARKYHPDSNQGDAKAEATFKEVSEAYSVLSDPEQRKEYDQIRAMGSGARFTAGGPARRLRGRLQHVRPGPGRPPVARGLRRHLQHVQPAAGRRLRLRRFGQSSGGFRGYGGPARRRCHRPDDDRLHHRHQGRDDHAAGRGRQAVQGEDPRRCRGRAEDPPAGTGRRPRTAARQATSWCR